MTQPSTPAHPGHIVFVDADTQAERSRPASEVPSTVAWAADAQGQRAPVVRIVTHQRGAQRVIESFGADGALLLRTTQAPPPPGLGRPR